MELEKKKTKNNTKKISDDKIKSASVSVSVTDDKMINEIIGNMGKNTKNKGNKTLINNFLNEKKKNDSNTKSNLTIENSNNLTNSKENKKTFTENLTKEDINQKLEDYKLVDDISKVPLDTHLRYFIKKDGEMLFRMGGNLKRNLDLPNYIVLKNAQGIEWSVQVKDTLFYKKMTIKEIKEEYEIIISDLHDKIKKLKNKIKDLEK